MSSLLQLYYMSGTFNMLYNSHAPALRSHVADYKCRIFLAIKLGLVVQELDNALHTGGYRFIHWLAVRMWCEEPVLAIST